MKVAMLGCLPPQRGISGYCYGLVEAMSKQIPVNFISFKKMYPSFLYPKGGLKDDNTYPELNNKNLRIYRKLTYYNPLTWIKAGFTKGDVLHAQWWSWPLFPVYFTIFSLFKLRRKKIIVTVHNVLSHESGILDRIINSIIFRLANTLILHSDNNLGDMKKYFKINSNKLVKIPTGSYDYLDKNISKKEARKKLGLNDKDKVILNFGALREYKGIDILLEAFADVAKKDKNAKLIIAGKLWVDWKPFQEIIDKNNLKNNLKLFLNYIPTNEIKDFFVASDLVVLPYKNFSSQTAVGPVALAFHKPLIVTNVGGLPELVKDKRFVVESSNFKELSNKILFCLKNKKVLNALSKDSKDLANEFSWEDISKKTIKSYLMV